MHEELENFERNHVWDLVEPPPNRRPIGTKWVFKNKRGEDGMVVRKKQMDVKSAFPNGFIEEEVYVRQTPNFESARFPDRVYKLRKALYGPKQAPRACFAEQMSREFVMSLMGELQFFLGLQIKQGLEGTFVHQAKYTRDILKKFNMGDSKPMTTPMSTNTTLDADEDGEAVDQKYLKFTPKLGLWYSSGSSLSLRGFSDADHAGCRIDHKSTSGTCQLLGTSLVSWSSRKQASVSLSTTEAEYIAAASCCSQLLWMKATLSDFGLGFGKIPLLVDSTSAISVAKNPVLHSRTKHIDVTGWRCVDNALIKGEIESQWNGLIALLV
ncbi:hypothetical protein U9M48_027567 [Paspalum notatum var. saurae]|uniref:Reverse transcriptase Ty1/copia-type domain-containing protein n=1 Tax=Paspalum notatum var. saurae TaxID=547442 RepID=A0AAQ3TUM5_PASNO